MSRSDVAADQPELESQSLRRVRDEVKDGVAVAAASVAASVLFVLVATALMKLVG